MSKFKIIWFLLAVIATVVLSSCQRRALEEDFNITARIPVSIDWSQTNILAPLTDPTGGADIHRVAIRFFPKDGSEVFERYLEGNVVQGEIDVPIGSYSVVVMNESVYDTPYWGDAIRFTNADNYSEFAAHVIPDNPTLFPFYTPQAGDDLRIAPYKLASWSIDNFEVTRDMVTRSRAIARAAAQVNSRAVTRAPGDMVYALTDIVMRPLTYNVDVTATVENLVSAQMLQGVLQGFAGKVYMASAKTEQEPITHVFILNGRIWSDDSETHGTTHKKFLSFGPLPEASTYTLRMDVILVTGERYAPLTPLVYNVTNQVLSGTGINLDINTGLTLPYVKGGISVGGWGDDEIIKLQ